MFLALETVPTQFTTEIHYVLTPLGPIFFVQYLALACSAFHRRIATTCCLPQALGGRFYLLTLYLFEMLVYPRFFLVHAFCPNVFLRMWPDACNSLASQRLMTFILTAREHQGEGLPVSGLEAVYASVPDRAHRRPSNVHTCFAGTLLSSPREKSSITLKVLRSNRSSNCLNSRLTVKNEAIVVQRQRYRCVTKTPYRRRETLSQSRHSRTVRQ